MAATAADEAAMGYLVSLPTKDERRAVASVSRAELLTAVRALSGCQRCGFVEQVLAAFDPELAAAAFCDAPAPNSDPSAELPAASAAESASVVAGLRNARDGEPQGAGAGVALGRGPGQGQLSASAAAAAPPASSVSSPAAEVAGAATAAATRPPDSAVTCAGAMAPAQILALLSDRGGSSDLVGLLQFAWRSSCVPGRGVAGGRGGGGGGDRLALSDSLLSRPRLLRRFLLESLGIMRSLADDVGDCRRHGGYPGPAELASTLARLDTQRGHTLQRLAAWGVLRAPPAAAAAAVGNTEADARQVPAARSADPDAGLAVSAAAAAADVDSQLALAIHLSLRDSLAGLPTAAAAAAAAATSPPAAHLARGQLSPPPMAVAVAVPPPPPADGSSPEPVLECEPSRQPQPQRPQRTPPRPTGGSLTATATAVSWERVGGRASPSLRGLGTWSGPGPGRSSPVDAAGGPEAAAARQQPQSPLAPTPVTTPQQQLPQLRELQVEKEDALAATAVAVAAAAAAAPLPVADAVAAAEGLADATVLVDDAAVAALSEGLRERVQHLVAQLVQVQQRRGRLEHACQHGILAAGRKLLLILLQMLWAELRRAAAAAAAAEAAAVEAAEATPQAGVASPGSGGSIGRHLAAEPPSRTVPPPPLSPSPPPPQQQQQQRRRPRYEGLLAELAAGLGEDDTHLLLGLDLDLDPEPDLELVADAQLELGMRRAGRDAVGGLGNAAGSGSGRGRNGIRDRVAMGLGHVADRGDEVIGDGTCGPGADTARDGASSGGGWAAALAAATGGDGDVAYGPHSLSLPAAAGAAAAAPLRHSPAAPPSAAAAGCQAAPLRGTVGWAAGGGAVAGRGGDGSSRAGTLLEFGGLGGGASMLEGGCACAAAREQQAEQLRVLQGQLSRCQASQSELQGEVGRLLDMLAEQRRTQEQATAALRREMAQWQGEPGALADLGAEELGELAARLEAALSRVRAAQLQAAAERDLLCPVCWERRKGLVFGCGHQTCCACGERLSACPICREPVSLRIRVYS